MIDCIMPRAMRTPVDLHAACNIALRQTRRCFLRRRDAAHPHFYPLDPRAMPIATVGGLRSSLL